MSEEENISSTTHMAWIKYKPKTVVVAKGGIAIVRFEFTYDDKNSEKQKHLQ